MTKLSMPSLSSIRAQDLALRTLRAAINEDRVAGAYLFEGPSGVGKEKTALAFAASLLGEGERVSRGLHPDLRIWRPRDEGSHNLPVSVVREEILPFAEYAPFESKHAILLFPDADVSFPDAHPEAANALLKNLEEPKAGVHFVLLSSRPERLLPTIRSRTQRVRFARLPDNEVRAILVDHGQTSAFLETVVALADGRADRALELCKGESLQTIFELLVQLDDLLASSKPAPLLRIAADIAERDDLPLVLEAFALFYRDIVVSELGGKPAFPHPGDTLEKRAKRVGALKAAERASAAPELREALSRNAAKVLALESWLLGLE